MITTIKLNLQFFGEILSEEQENSAPSGNPEHLLAETPAIESANELMKKANHKLLIASVSAYAAEKMSSNGGKAALRMIDFSNCLDEDDILCEELVKEEVDNFLEEYTEFKKTECDTQKIPSFAAKTTKNSMRILTKEDIEKMSPLELADRWGEVELYLKGN